MRFVEEAQTGAQLQHPGMPPVHDLGRLDDGRLYFVMSEIRGKILIRRHRETERRAPGGVVTPKSPNPNLIAPINVFARVAEAVGYAHQRGVIHRDLKPSNIMLGDDGQVMVVDWGIAKVTGKGVETKELDNPLSSQSAKLEAVRTSSSIDGVRLTKVDGSEDP